MPEAAVTQRNPSQLVLAVGLDGALESKLGPVLERAEFEVAFAFTLAQAARLVRLVRFDAVLIAAAGGEDELHGLLAGIRDPGSSCSQASVILFLPADEMPLARAYLAAGVSQAVPASLGAAALQAIVLGLLHAKVRLAVRVLARLAVRLEGSVAQRLCQTLDLSRNGMFVVLDERFPVGAPVQFTLQLPRCGDGIRGEARVVRHVPAAPGRLGGVGLSFVRFDSHGESRLATYLDQVRG